MNKSKNVISNYSEWIACYFSIPLFLQSWSCPTPVLGPCVLRLEPGDYQSCVIPPDRESMWGPIPLQRLPAHIENYCSVASHKYGDY